MNPEQNRPPEAPNAQATQLLPAPRPAHDPRLGFRRQFIPMGPAPAAQAPAPPSLAEQMGQGLYDDPYYRPTSRPAGGGRKRVAIIVMIVVVLLGVASAAVLPVIKKNNPDGLFQNSGSR